jgi:hypothetical protein
MMQTTEFPMTNTNLLYELYNSIIQGSTNLYTVYNSYGLLPQYNIQNNTNFNNDLSNLVQEISYLFQVTTRLLGKYKINVVLIINSGLQLELSNYPIVNSIHGSGYLVKIILVSDQYSITSVTNTNFNSSIAYPTGYYVSDYYRLFNLSMHYDFQKYMFFAGYGGILRDSEYPNKTLASFYQKINNYLTSNLNTVDFSIFYAYQTGSYFPNMEGHLIQSYQAWIQRSAQPYFYYYNLLTQFNDMMYGYSGKTFISEYYTVDTNNNTYYNNRHDNIQGVTIYATRMAYGTRDVKGRLNNISKRYNLLDQRLVSIDNNFKHSTVINYDGNIDPIQIFNMLNILNQRFTDYQEFLVLIKNSMNVTGSYPNSDIYSTILTQYKVNSVSMFDLNIFNDWNSFLLNYYTTYNYNYSSLITGLSTTINLYNTMSSTTLDMSSLGYELYSFTNNFASVNQRNFADSNLLRYENATVYHNLIDQLNTSISTLMYFPDKDSFDSDVTYWNSNYSLVSLNFLDISIDKIMSLYQSDVAGFKQLFTSILNYRQKNVSTTAQTQEQIQLYNDYYSINDVTSLTFYDKFYKFNSATDYNLLPLVYHDIYNIQNASNTVVFYLNYLFSFLNNGSSKPNIGAYDDPTLPVSYYFPKYLSSGIDYFLANFHQLKFDSAAFYPYKSVPSQVTLYDGTKVERPKSFMYVFLLLKIQYRNYYYNTVDNAYLYSDQIDQNGNPVRQIIQLNTYTSYPDINADVVAFDGLVDSVAISGSIDHLQTITHPFLVNKHMDNLLFIKDLLNDLITVSDNATIYTILPNNDNYVEFLNEKTIVTNAFDNSGLIFGQYPYTLGVLSSYNYIGEIPIITPTGQNVNAYIEGNVVLPSLITQIYYFLISECFMLNQTELIGSSFQNTPMSLGNILGQLTAKDWKSGLINLISEYLFLILKSKKIIYQNSLYEISFSDIYNRIKVSTNSDKINDFLDMFINSLLTIKITTTNIATSYLAAYEQFKIPNIFSPINIKQNYNYSQYYRLMFALRQSIVGSYTTSTTITINNFQERVQFHNAYDYWLVNNVVLINDYTIVSYNNNNYMIRKSENSDQIPGVVPGLNYYYNNSTNIPPNLFTTIIDYIITNIQNGIVGSSQNKYNFQNFVYVKNGTYQITMTLYNVYFTTNDQLYTIIIDIIAGTVQGIPTSGTGQPFIINYNNLPFGYQYDFINNGLIYQQLLYQSDISIIENMFLIFKNIQDINQSLTTLTLYSTPYTSDSMNMSNFNFMNFASFIESFIQYDFTSKVTNPILVLPVIIPASSPLNVTTLFNITLTNWTKFYGNYYYLYDVSDPNSIPTSANYLGSSNVQYINNIYSGSIYITFKTAGLHYLCLTNALIDSKNPFGSSIVAVRFVLPISTSVISDGSIDNNTAIITIPQTITVNLFNWPSSINITQLYTYFSLSPDGNVDNLQNAAGVVGVGNGPFNIIRYLPSNSNVYAYKIITNLTFNTNTSYYLYVSEKPTAAELSNALVYTLIPNITKQETINVATDIDPVSKICTISPNVIYQGLSQLITIKLINWFSYYNINNLYVYLADNPNGNNLGNDQGDLNVPQAYAQIINSTITFNVSIRYLTNYYVYLTYNQISDYPYGSRPVNFIVNPTDPISVRNITGVTGNINISSVIVNRSTNFIITLGNWLASYTTYGINKLYAYYKDINDDPNNYLNYKPFNTTPYSIILTPNGYQVNITYTLTMNMQANIFLTYNPISSTYPYGTGVVNVMVTQTITTTNQMVITSLTPNTNVPTFTNTTFIGTVLNTWNPILLPYHLNVFIGKTITSSTPVATTVTIINSVPNYGFVVDSQIQASQYNNSNIAFSDSTTYGSGYIETNLINFSTIIGNINANFVQFYVFNNIPFTFNIQLNNWDSTYNINNVFVYVVDNSNNLLFDFGSQSVQLNNNKYYLQFTATPTGFDPDTYYNVYISDTDFNISGYKFKQLLTNQLYIIRDQISISSILTTPYQFKTYASTIFNGQLANWLPTVYPSNLLNVLYTDVYTNITTTVPITINNDGTFSFTTTINTLPGITVLLSDSISYIKSNSYPINSIIGNINTTMATTSVIQGITTNVIITLTNWNPSYNVSSLYIYVGSDQNTPLEIYGANPDLIYLDTDLKYKLSVNITPTLALGTYSIFLSNTNPSNIFYKIRQLITNSFEITGLSMYSFYFDPSNVSGMIAWLDASTIYNLIINNDLIIQWSDTSGNNNNATNSSNYPVYDSINLGVNFSGGNYLILPDGTIPYNNDSYSIYVVLTPSSNTQFILGSVDDVNNLNNLGINSTNTFWTNNNTYYQSWNNNLDLVSSYTPNVKQIVLFEYINGGDRTTYINGVNSGSDTPNPRASTKYNNLIGGLLENNTFTNLIHEIIIYSNPLTMDDKNNIENYLSSKWDIVKY